MSTQLVILELFFFPTKAYHVLTPSFLIVHIECKTEYQIKLAVRQFKSDVISFNRPRLYTLCAVSSSPLHEQFIYEIGHKS